MNLFSLIKGSVHVLSNDYPVSISRVACCLIHNSTLKIIVLLLINEKSNSGLSLKIHYPNSDFSTKLTRAFPLRKQCKESSELNTLQAKKTICPIIDEIKVLSAVVNQACHFFYGGTFEITTRLPFIDFS